MEKELYELSEGQQIVADSQKYIKHKEVMNIALEIQIDEDIDVETLLKATKETILRNPSNRTRIINKDEHFYQYFSNDEIEDIELIVFDSEDNYDDFIDSFAKTPFENDGIDSKLYRVSIIKKPNGRIAICGCFSHLIYDAYSSAMFFKETFNNYHLILENKTLSKISVSPFEIYEAHKKYLNSKKHELDRLFYDNFYKTEPQFTILSGKKSKCFMKNKRSGLREVMVDPTYKGETLVIPISNDFRDTVYQYSNINRVTPQILYLLACRTYLALKCNTNDVTISNTINKRSTIIEQKAGGTMADCILFRTVFDNDISFKEGISKCYSTIIEQYKHSYFDSSEVGGIFENRFGISPMEKYDSTIFTFQPAIKLDDSMKYSLKRLPNGREWVSCYINVLPCNSDNEYVVDYSYMSKLVSEDTIRDYHDFMINFIKEGIANDSAKISDIIAKVGK